MPEPAEREECDAAVHPCRGSVASLPCRTAGCAGLPTAGRGSGRGARGRLPTLARPVTGGVVPSPVRQQPPLGAGPPRPAPPRRRGRSGCGRSGHRPPGRGSTTGVRAAGGRRRRRSGRSHLGLRDPSAGALAGPRLRGRAAGRWAGVDVARNRWRPVRRTRRWRRQHPRRQPDPAGPRISGSPRWSTRGCTTRGPPRSSRSEGAPTPGRSCEPECGRSRTRPRRSGARSDTCPRTRTTTAVGWTWDHRSVADLIDSTTHPRIHAGRKLRGALVQRRVRHGRRRTPAHCTT